MERLTKPHFVEDCVELVKCKNMHCNSDCGYCDFQHEANHKLKYFEDLEDLLKSIYGDCDGLLAKTIKYLVKHKGAEIGTPFKARLLTDEDVDKWEEYKELDKQGLISRPQTVLN